MNIVARPDLLEFLLLEPRGKKSQLQCAVWVEICELFPEGDIRELIVEQFLETRMEK